MFSNFFQLSYQAINMMFEQVGCSLYGAVFT